MYRMVPQLESEKVNKRRMQGAGLFTQFSVKPTFRAWQMTTKATKAQEAHVRDSEEQIRELLGL